MNGMRKIGLVFLALGFFGSAFVSVRHGDSAGLAWRTVEWGWYALPFLIGVAGVIILRTTAKQADTHSHKLDTNMATLESCLARLLGRLQAMIGDSQSIFVYDVHTRIDDELAEDLASFADARESIAHRFGLQSYADVMTRFALGERNINRAWSASADGYVDEVWLSLGRAETEMSGAQALLQSLRARSPD